MTSIKIGIEKLVVVTRVFLIRFFLSLEKRNRYLILLVAMIGAIVLTMHRTTKVKRQDVFRRNALDSRRTTDHDLLKGSILAQ